MRAAILVLGPLVAKHGSADVSLPGGCAIGARPVNIHVAGLQAMGAEVHIENGYIRARAGRLRGARIVMDTVTVTGTENLMMAATLAEGQTILENAAREPEIVDLAQFLIAMGAKIRGHGTDTIIIEGVEALHGANYEVLPDRIEAGTYLVAGAITGGRVRARNARAEHLDAVLGKLAEAGARRACAGDDFDRGGHARPPADAPSTSAPRRIRVSRPTCRRSSRRSIPWPTASARSSRRSSRTASCTCWKCGAWAPRSGSRATRPSSRACRKLTAAPVMATDLRASASLVLAGLVAEGTTDVERIYHIDRGYECIEEKLQGLGAQIRRRAD